MKIVISGASGFLSSTLAHIAAKEHQIIGLFNTTPMQIEGVNMLQVNLLNTDAIKALLTSEKPDVLIHAAAESNPNTCELEPDKSYQINFLATKNLVEICNDLKIKLLFTSTDLVFDGETAPYDVTDEAKPICIYGKHKLLAEAEVLKYERNVVARMPLMFGSDQFSGKSFFVAMQKELVNGNTIKLFTDEYRTPVDIQTTSEGLLCLAEQGSGLFHLGGKESVSRYEIGCLLAEKLGVDKSLVAKAKQADIKMPAARPANVSLISNFSHASFYKVSSLQEQISNLI